MPSFARSRFKGPRRKLVLAFDIGTTFSGISYSILDPGEIPKIDRVTRYPGQEKVGDCKIPTIIYYDKDGKVRAVGAEAAEEGREFEAEEEGWTKAEWFKLHLRPRSSESSFKDVKKIPALPKNKSVVDLFADFLKYLYDHALKFIQETYCKDFDLLASVRKKEDIDFILAHPNGWRGAQQAELRRATVRAGLVPNTNAGRSRVHFVTEGEASLHFCISNGLTTSALENGNGVLIVDAGGGTIDLSAYSRNFSGEKYLLKEIAAPQCYFKGSVFVTKKAERFLQKKLDGSKFRGDTSHIAKVFDRTTKLRFRPENRDDAQYIQFGTIRDIDSQYDIRGGRIKLNGSDVANFFRPSVDCIVRAIREQQKSSKIPISCVLLVGGFSASNWLFSQIERSLKHGLALFRPHNNESKAVADGAVSYFIDHVVNERISKYHYGTEVYIPYDPNDDEHIRRSGTVFVDIDGEDKVPGKFSVILPKDVQVSETKEFRRPYRRNFGAKSDFPQRYQEPIMCYTGRSPSPRWIDEDPNNYPTLCRIVF